MDTTTFLAQLWGPAMLAVGLGIFASRKYYVRIYRDLEKETLSVLLFGITAIAAGIAQIHFHNTWGSVTEIIISLLGWMLLIKGLAMTIVPSVVDRGGDFEVKNQLLPASGTVLIILGVYLSWVGFFI
jgi:hypothetical protein